MNPLMQDAHIFGPLFADPEISAAFGNDRFIARFCDFERALAETLADLGAVPADVATAAVAAIDSFEPNLDRIRQNVLTDGLPAPEFARQLKAHAGADCAAAIHAGVTSQDLIDTAMILAVRDANHILVRRTLAVIAGLSRLQDSFGQNQMMGRTRMQAALPITVADRLAGWHDPLLTHLDRLDQVQPRIEVLQFGGAVGNRAGAGNIADTLAAGIARKLELNNPPRAWHVMRDGVADYAGWLSLMTGTMGKMGQDVCLMAQQGVDEIRLSGGGTSSAMPHKQNPVLAETLVTFARFNATQLSGMHHAMVHEQERSGTAWTLEWMMLPTMVTVTGKALLLAETLLSKIEQLGTPE